MPWAAYEAAAFEVSVSPSGLLVSAPSAPTRHPLSFPPVLAANAVEGGRLGLAAPGEGGRLVSHFSSLTGEKAGVHDQSSPSLFKGLW